MNPDGSLHYSFMETLTELYPYWHMRAGGGVIYLISILVFIFNMIKTIQNGKPASGVTAATAGTV